MKQITTWEFLCDTPEEFKNAIKHACSENERIFFEKLRYKMLYETAFSNDVLMNDKDNEDRIFIVRSRFDDILIGSKKEDIPACEYEGIFHALEEDMYIYTGQHITLLEWLRKRDYHGIRYDANNDYI